MRPKALERKLDVRYMKNAMKLAKVLKGKRQKKYIFYSVQLTA